MKIQIIKCLQDNYSYLIIDETNQNACVVDPSEAKPIIDFVEKNNINLKYKNYKSVTYTQNLSKTFIPNLSIIDVLANNGPKTHEFLKS